MPPGPRPALFPRERAAGAAQHRSDLEGHPTPRLPFVDVATGSLGQGICAAIGIALNARRIESDYRTYVLLGDGEMAEGSVWEAARRRRSHYKLDNLCGDHRRQRARPEPADAVRHHDMDAIARALERVRLARASSSTATTSTRCSMRCDEARATKGRPTMIVARTIKGKGVSAIEGKDGWHGKALKKGEEADKAIAELEAQLVPGGDVDAATSRRRRRAAPEPRRRLRQACRRPRTRRVTSWRRAKRGAPPWPRSASVDPRVVALDADVKNSTFSDRFEKAHPSASTRCSSPSR